MVYVFSDWELDEQRCELRQAGQSIDAIEPRMFDVLLYLIVNRGRVITKEELHTQCWHGDAVTDSALVRCISGLRKVLRDNPREPQMIKTVTRKGYIFLASVTVCGNSEVQSEVAKEGLASPNLAPGELMEQFEAMISTVSPHCLINAPDYLRMLRQTVSEFEHSAGAAEMVVRIKEEIKSFCISSESYFTRKTAEDKGGGDFLYACSSLIDRGYRAYLQDRGWQNLLWTMGQVAEQYGGHFARVFFVDFEPLHRRDFEALQEVITLHLQNRVKVALMDQTALPDEVRPKRNMAWLQGHLLLHATDQIQWDLDVSDHKTTISEAREKHDFFVTHAEQIFSLRDVNRVNPILADLFPQSKN